MLIYFKEKPFQNKWLDQVSILGSKIRAPFFLLILAVSAVGGVIAYIKDLQHPFSTSGQVSQYIRDHHLENSELIGSRDYAVSPIASQLNKEIYYTQRNKPGTFIIYDSLRANFWSFNDVQATINEKWIRNKQPILLLKDTPLRMTFNDTGQSIEWDKGTLNDSLSMKLLIKIPPGIVQDEQYYVYIIDRTSAL
jgi:hypothetical protein